MSLPNRLKAWRKHLGLSQSALANKINIPVRSIQSYEAGERSPGVEVLSAFAETGLDLNWLIIGDEEKSISTKELAPFWNEFNTIFSQLIALNDLKRQKIIKEFGERVDDAVKALRLDSLSPELLESNQNEGISLSEFDNLMLVWMEKRRKHEKEVAARSLEHDENFHKMMQSQMKQLKRRESNHE